MFTQPLAIALGVPISRWILDHVHWAGLAGWRWVFILEGILPIVMGVLTLWYLTDRPENARWLAEREKRWLAAQLKAEEDAKAASGRVGVMDAVRSRQTFLLIAIYFLIVTGNQALIFFLPSITENFKNMAVEVRRLGAAMPYACSALRILLNGMWAHFSVWLGLTAQAYLSAFWTLPTVLLGRSAAATAVGLICLGNLGGFAGPWLFGYLRTVTDRYDTGF